MLTPETMIAILTSRSFGSIWYWIVLVGLWSGAGRAILGVPLDVLARARQALRAAGAKDAAGSDRGADAHPAAAAMLLLDWLSLTLPRWRLGAGASAWLFGAVCFALTALAVMGWGYRAQMAQATFLLLAPLSVLFWMRVALARRLAVLLDGAAAAAGPVAVDAVAADIVVRMVTHRRLTTLLSVISVSVAAIYGALWMALHPNGL